MSTPPGTTNQSQPSNAGQSQPASGQSQSGNKEIKDPNEYNAYISALNTADAAQKAAAMEAFVKQYPQSVVKLDAQEQAMAAYQGANNPAKVREMALAILQDNPNHVRARAIVTAFDRAASTNGDTTTLKEGCDAAQKGLQGLSSWTKPEGMADG
ncbi:MAG TPA: hypothetical protein VFC07_10415, partial [Verrucomicrobiae bacterium]|nr:hypothetical protein [Verrucomicrobiae bacterium]